MNNSTNCTEQFSTEPTFNFALKTCASMLAALTNLINIFVFSRMKLKNDILKYSLVISIADLLYSLIIIEISLVQFFYQALNQQVIKLINGKFLDEYFTSCVAIFILLIDVYISLQRYLIVTNKYTWYMKSVSFKASLMMILMLSLIYYLPSLALFRVEHICGGVYILDSTEFGRTTFGVVVRIVLNMGRILLLICVLPVMNIFIWIQLKRAMKKKKMLRFNGFTSQLAIGKIMPFKNYICVLF